MQSETVLAGNDEKLGAGSWVYTHQGVAAEQGFNHVSKHWYPQTMSFEDGMAQIEVDRQERNDIIADARNIQFVTLGGKDFRVDIDGNQYTPSDWSARQLCNWFGVPQTMWTYYMSKERDWQDVELVQKAFINGRRKFDKPKNLLFRTYKDGTLRGVMSEKYSTVDNRWYLELLKKYIPGGRLSHWRSDADTLYGNVLVPDTIREESDSDYGGMLSISNCEIGKRVVAQTPSIFRAICMNGCIWGETKGIELRQRHIHINLELFAEAIRLNIHKQIPLLTTQTSALIGTHSMKAETSIANLFAAIAKRNNFSHEVVGQFSVEWNNFSNEKTAFGVYDAVTRAGQKFSPDIWVKCDEIGGQILTGGAVGWDRLNGFAKSMTDKEVGKIYGVAL